MQKRDVTRISTIYIVILATFKVIFNNYNDDDLLIKTKNKMQEIIAI